MITEFIMGMATGIVTALFSLVPTFETGAVMDPVKSMAVSAGSLNGWLPQQFILGCLLLMIGVRLWFLVIDGLQWLYHLIPFNH